MSWKAPEWTAEQLAILRTKWPDPQCDIDDVAREIGLSSMSCGKRARRIGLGKKARSLGCAAVRWTPSAAGHVVELWRSGKSAAWIADNTPYGYTRAAITAKMSRLGYGKAPPVVKVGGPAPWTPEENEVLRQGWLTTRPADEIARRIGKSRTAVFQQAHRLDLPPKPRISMSERSLIAHAQKAASEIPWQPNQDSRHVANCLLEGGFPSLSEREIGRDGRGRREMVACLPLTRAA